MTNWAPLTAAAFLGLIGAGLSADTSVAGERGYDRRGYAVRDCVPYNGRFGYYGNPWCDTGSYRLEDQEFRERRYKRSRWRNSQG